MTVCPCCGSKFEGDLRDGCAACGARAVGPPLVRPERELPFYGRALAVGAAGALLFLTFTTATLASLFEQKPLAFDFWKIVAAAETAAWRLKWTALPLSLPLLWASWRVRRQLRREPMRFGGLRVARAGLALSAVFTLACATLIGVTVPERLRKREAALRAADQSLVYAAHRVLLQYNARFGSLPATPDDLLRLPDEDGSVAQVRAMLSAGDYSPEANLAALPPPGRKGRGRRASAVRLTPASAKTNTDGAPTESLSLTNYGLVLPGRDKLLNTEDDIRVRDGVVVETAPSSQKQAVRSSSTPTSNLAVVP